MNTPGTGRVLSVLAAVVVLLALGAGLWTIGAPWVQRDVRLDERREKELDRLHDAVEEHWRENGALPASLQLLASRPGVRLAIVDPKTGESYGYTITGATTFQLCASFATDSAQALDEGRRWANHSFPHGVGLTCFDRRAKSIPDSAARVTE